MSTTEVLIVGAGPVGMTLAMELSIQGVSFRIVDKAPERSDKSRALGVHSRTLEVLNRYGESIKELLGKSNRLAGNAMWVGGKRYEAFNGSFRAAAAATRDTQFAGFFLISQVDTEDFLAKQLDERGVTVERPVSVKSVVQDGGGVDVVLVREDGSEEAVRCRYAVGCDGAHSVVRHAMDVQFEGDAYPQEFILVDTHIDWEEAAGKGHIFLGDGLVMMLPMKAGQVRLIASRPDQVATDAEPTLQDFQDLLETMLPTGDSLPRPRLHDPTWLARFHLHHRCVTKYRDGKLFVAGDAAHIHSPVGGQGMNTGIQDSVNLGWKLARVLKGERPDSYLDTYHEERWPVGQHLVTQTDQLFTFLTTRNPNFRFMRNLLLPHALPSIASTPDVGLGLLRFMSELGVKYRRSPIVHTADGFAGSVRGGFRAPEGPVRTPDGKGTFLQNLLRGPGFHLLLFVATADAKEVDEAEQKFLGVTKDAQVHVITAADAQSSKGVADVSGELHKRYGFEAKSGYVYVRPDGYVENIGYLDDFDELLKWLKA